MEVLKSDFEKTLPVIKEALLDADFISVDAEFTGFYQFSFLKLSS